MKRILCSALCAALAGAALSGCSIPGLEQDNEDRRMSDSYGVEASSENEDVQNYSWLMEPSVSADNIITFDGSQVDPDNEQNSAYKYFSVIQQNGRYGLIDYSGKIIVQPEYDDYYTCWCGEITLFNVIDDKNGVYEYCTVDGSGQTSTYAADHSDNSLRYFRDESSGKIYSVENGENTASEYTGKKAVVVGEAKITEADGNIQIEPDENSFYGLVKEGELLLEMEYTDFYAPDYKGAGLTCIALKNNDGKWGYVGSDGKTVIDFKCDGDMSSYGGRVIDDDSSSHPYLFTGDYVPVSVNASYGYYMIDGSCVVRPGEFEQARPVHNGRAWVKKGGLWGVIRLGEIVEEELADESSAAETTTTTTYYYTTSETTTTTESYSETTTTTWQETETSWETESVYESETTPQQTEITAETELTETQPVVTESQPPETLPPETSAEVPQVTEAAQ